MVNVGVQPAHFFCILNLNLSPNLSVDDVNWGSLDEVDCSNLDVAGALTFLKITDADWSTLDVSHAAAITPNIDVCSL